MKPGLKIAVLVLSIGYPFMVYWGLQYFDTRILLVLLLLILALRWAAGNQASERKIVVATILSVTLIILVWGHQSGLKFYPVLMNIGFFTLFASSLFFPPTVVERLARFHEPDLPPAAVLYTRKVTWVWSVFFLINGTIAGLTALWSSDKVWMLYNGFIAYLLIGALASGEWLVRQRIKRD